MTALSALLDRLSAGMKHLAAVCLLGMAAVTGVDVVGRGAFNAPLFGSEEIVSILAALVVGLSLPYAHAQRSHIGVEVVFRRLGPRTRRALRLMTQTLSCVLFVVVAWRLALYGLSLRAVGTVSMNLGLPTYYVLWALSLGFAIFAACLARTVWRTFGDKEPE
jgi:TRAP-type C4-dicarboxylate transport system permease small subunit